MEPDPRRPDKHIDPGTRIWPIAEWGGECGRGLNPAVKPSARKKATRKRRKPPAK